MKVDYDQGRLIISTHFCGICEKPLVMRWNGDIDSYEVVCRMHPEEDKFIPRSSLTKAYNQGVPIPLEVQSRIESKLDASKTDVISSYVRNGIDAGTKKQITLAEAYALIAWAEEVNLKPELGHVVLMYHKPYPTVDGLVYNARRLDPGLRFHIEIVKLEDKLAMGLEADDIVVLCRVFNGIDREIAARFGIVRSHELTEETQKEPGQLRYPIVAAKPLEMAEARAMWDAFSDAYPLGLEYQNKGYEP